jgi:hypothetical protein
MIRNPVARHINTFNKPSVVASKRRSLQSEATLRDEREVLSESLFDSETKGFDGYSVDLWVLDEMSEVIHEENACLGCIGCSSIEVDFEED